MGRSYRRQLFLMVMTGCLLVRPVHAQDDVEDFAELDLEEMLNTVYSAAKHKQDVLMSPSAVSVIDREQIENSHCFDLVCLLRQLPEVDVMRIKALWSSVGGRALNLPLGDKVLVLIDGQEHVVEMFGVVFWQGLPVHLDDIERIEVIRGPGSALYGANAHSLVVSIDTRKSEQATAEMFVGGGEWDRQSLHLRLEQPLGSWRLRLSGGAETSGHFVLASRREKEVGRVRLGVDHQGDAGQFVLQAGLTALEGRVQTFFLPGWLRDGLTSEVLARYQTDWLRAQVSYSFLQAVLITDFPVYVSGVKLGEFGDYPLESHTADTLVELTWSPFEGNLLIGGGNFRYVVLLAEDNDPDVVDQYRLGLFIQDKHSFGASLELTAGVRMDFNNLTPWAISPRGALVWRLAESQSLRVGLSRAFRKPSFLNTHFHPTVFDPEPGFDEVKMWLQQNLGNPGLGNESVTTLEAGYTARFLDGNIQLEADVFYNWYRNAINLFVEMQSNEFGLPDLPNSTTQFRNTGNDVNSLGGSLSCTFRIMKQLRLSGNYTYRYSREIPKRDRRLTGEPAHLFNLMVYYLGAQGVRLGAALHTRSIMEATLPREADLFGGTVYVQNPAMLLLSAFLSYRRSLGGGEHSSPWVEAGVRASNLLRAGFRDYMAVYARDGTELGGQWIGRQVIFFARGAI